MRVPGALKNTGTNVLSMRNESYDSSDQGSGNGNGFGTTLGGGADVAKK